MSESLCRKESVFVSPVRAVAARREVIKFAGVSVWPSGGWESEHTDDTNSRRKKPQKESAAKTRREQLVRLQQRGCGGGRWCVTGETRGQEEFTEIDAEEETGPQTSAHVVHLIDFFFYQIVCASFSLCSDYLSSEVCQVRWSVAVHRTVLELHSQTELQRSAEQLKQLRLLTSDVSISSSAVVTVCRREHITTWSQTRFTPSWDEVFTGAAELKVLICCTSSAARQQCKDHLLRSGSDQHGGSRRLSFNVWVNCSFLKHVNIF